MRAGRGAEAVVQHDDVADARTQEAERERDADVHPDREQGCARPLARDCATQQRTEHRREQDGPEQACAQAHAVEWVQEAGAKLAELVVAAGEGGAQLIMGFDTGPREQRRQHDVVGDEGEQHDLDRGGTCGQNERVADVEAARGAGEVQDQHVSDGQRYEQRRGRDDGLLFDPEQQPVERARRGHVFGRAIGRRRQRGAFRRRLDRLSVSDFGLVHVQLRRRARARPAPSPVRVRK